MSNYQSRVPGVNWHQQSGAWAVVWKQGGRQFSRIVRPEKPGAPDDIEAARVKAEEMKEQADQGLVKGRPTWKANYQSRAPGVNWNKQAEAWAVRWKDGGKRNFKLVRPENAGAPDDIEAARVKAEAVKKWPTRPPQL